MTLDRGLLFGSLGLFASSGGIALATKNKERISYIFSRNLHLSIYRANLECRRGRNKVTNCSIYRGEKVMVSRGEGTNFEIDALSGGGKLKAYRVDPSEDYSNNYKFIIEDNDITDSAATTRLLEQETYEVILGTEGNLKGKYHLSRKSEAKDQIKKALNLPCDLPTSNGSPVDCDLSEDHLKRIKFKGATEENITFTGSPKLTITKEEHKHIYPLGYRFSFSSKNGNSSMTIGDETTNLKQNMDMDFIIKREGSKLSLENPWNADVLMNKVFMNKKDDHWILGGGSMHIKQENNKSSSSLRLTVSDVGKIKHFKDEPGYHQGLKFVIEGGDMRFQANSNHVNKLSRYETYEVSQHGGRWYFNRKKKASQVFKEVLGFPQDCLISDSSTVAQCTLDANKLKAIRFEGKDENGVVTISDGNSVTLKSEENGNYPGGYRFSMVSDKVVTIKLANEQMITINKNTDTEFKIKRVVNGNNISLSLERSWTPESLGEKINLRNCNSNEKKCNFGDSINVYEDERNHVGGILLSDTSLKINYEENVEGYNQGFRFSVDNDVKLVGSSSISKLHSKTGTTGKTITYEIREKTIKGDTKWYLVKKSS